MAKIVNTKARKRPTFMRPSSEASNVLISCFMRGIELIERSGRRILNVLKDLSDELLLMPGIQPMTEIITTKKSSQFHTSRMKLFLCSAKPIARILATHSNVNMIENAVSTLAILALRWEK